MRLDKVVLRTIVSTLCAIALLCGATFAVATWLYPSTMMKIAYELGDDPGAIRYAYRSYERTNELYYVVFAMEVSIGIDDYGEVEFYAERFVQDDEFETYCAEVDGDRNYSAGTYAKYAYGQLVMAEYEQGKKQEAFDHATESLGGGFAENNAMIALLFTAMEHQDGGTVNAVVAKMQEISLTLENGVDKTYLDKILENLK